MFCTNCGAQMAEGQRFCSNCGAMAEPKVPRPEPTQPEPPAAQPEAAYTPPQPTYTPPQPTYTPPQPAYTPPAQPTYTPPQPAYTPPAQPPIKPDRPKKKGRGWLVALIVLAVLAAGVFAALRFTPLGSTAENFVARSFSSPAEYYQRVERNGVDALLASAEESSVARMQEELRFMESKLQLSFNESALSDELLDLIQDEIGTDITWFKNVGAYVSLGRDGNRSGGSITAFLNDKDIIDAEFLSDLDKMTTYGRVPKLSSDYIGVDMSEYGDEMHNTIAAMQEYVELMQDGELARTLVDRYSEIVIKDLTKVEKDTVELTVGSQSGKFTVLHVTADGEVLLPLTQDVLNKAKNDAELQKLLVASLKTNGYSEDEVSEMLTYLLQEIDDALENLASKKPEEIKLCVLMDVYVDNAGKVIGRDIRVLNDGELQGAFFSAYIRKGTDLSVKTRLELSEAVNDLGLLVVTGEGDGKLSLSGEVNGSLTLRVEADEDFTGDEAIDLTAATMDLHLAYDRQSKAASWRIGLTPTKELMDLALKEVGEELPEAEEKLLRGLGLVFSGELRGSAITVEGAETVDGKELLKASAETYPVEEFSLRVPSEYLSPEEWAAGIDYSKLYGILNDLIEAGFPASSLNGLI